MKQVGILLMLVLLSVSHAHVDIQEPAGISRFVLAASKLDCVSCVCFFLSNY